MTTLHTDTLQCDQCGVEGREHWSEGGHMDQHEKTSAVEGEFEASPSSAPPGGPQQRDEIVCRRCSGRPRTVSSKLADGPFPAAVKKVAVPPVRDRVPTVAASGG
jgi:hypothetical protein